MPHRFKAGDRVRLRRLTDTDKIAQIGNDRFNIPAECFDQEVRIRECNVNRHWGLLYIFDHGRYERWSVLEEMVVPLRALVNPVTYRVQHGPDLYKREAEDGLSPVQLVAELIGSGSWEGVGEANSSMLRGERAGVPFTILRV